MMIIPQGKPVVQNLNSYYLNIPRLIEHYQGELGAGGIHFKSTMAEGIIYFDNETILNGFFRDKDSSFEGNAAIDRFFERLPNNNFSVSVYRIDPDRIYFWANLHHADALYKNLSTEFTDLEGLVKKLNSEKLTGYINASITGKDENGLIFFDNGLIIGCACSWDIDGAGSLKENLEALIRKLKVSGGVFNVFKISIEHITAGDSGYKATPTQPIHVLEMIQELLFVFESVVRGNPKIKADFDTLLKRKFVEKANRYDFLDPFAAEFQYIKGKVHFNGLAEDDQLVRGVLESVYELAADLGMLSQVRKNLFPWYNKYEKEIKIWDLE